MCINIVVRGLSSLSEYKYISNEFHTKLKKRLQKKIKSINIQSVNASVLFNTLNATRKKVNFFADYYTIL